MINHLSRPLWYIHKIRWYPMLRKCEILLRFSFRVSGRWFFDVYFIACTVDHGNKKGTPDRLKGVIHRIILFIVFATPFRQWWASCFVGFYIKQRCFSQRCMLHLKCWWFQIYKIECKHIFISYVKKTKVELKFLPFYVALFRPLIYSILSFRFTDCNTAWWHQTMLWANLESTLMRPLFIRQFHRFTVNSQNMNH